MRSPGFSAFLLALLIAALPARAEIFKWLDEQGRLHFAQELHNVPVRYRSQAQKNTVSSTPPSPVQLYDAPPRTTRPRRAATRSWGHTGGGSYEVPVERAGSQLLVSVRINDVVDAPFFIDTGASRGLVPRWVIERADVDIEGAPTQFANTANGLIEVPIITLDSVDLHGARVEQVPAAVSDSLKIGLLGLSFLNHFEYSIDPTAGVVRLRENNLGYEGAIAGQR